ncbi:MAG TPA: organomercurial lyase [Candidatus Dormibacteraeota bacterium]|nr:organomercurial lyase [Candidatus Dormibacteraeota bacterium]
MDARDLELRNLTYRFMAQAGRAPTADDVAVAAGLDPGDVAAGWRRLHDAQALVLDSEGAIRMLNPFSAVPTSFRVEAAGRSWFANCGWDAFGIGAALHVDSVIDTECGDCHEPLRIAVRDRRPDLPDLLWHVLVPAREWWRDIGYT